MQVSELVRLALEEDLGPGDITTTACVAADAAGTATIYAKQELVVCGHAPAKEVFRQMGAEYVERVAEGAMAVSRQVIAEVRGPHRSLLTGERCALNFLMRLSGIATHVRTVVTAAKGLKVVDTRKTTPLHRQLEKHAVRMGGASNHRFGLYDGVMIKDNHIVAAGGIAAAVARARAMVHPLLKVEVEVESLEELEQALAAGADVIMLDNMSNELLAQAVKMAGGRAILEASGNMDGARAGSLAGSGIDYVSMGGLIHQARWVDLSMRIQES
jgi:nicotinate-nucleotide pyrophosphorylase (carboxylating)